MNNLNLEKDKFNYYYSEKEKQYLQDDSFLNEEEEGFNYYYSEKEKQYLQNNSFSNEEKDKFNNFYTEKEKQYPQNNSFSNEEEESIFSCLDKSMKNNDAILNKNYIQSSEINSNLLLIPLQVPNLLTKKTQETSINYFPEQNHIEKNDDNVLKNNSFKSEKNIYKKRGRKRKDEIDGSNEVHNKFTDDNVMRKIKTAIFKYILSWLNESLEFTKEKFYPLNAELNKNLNKDVNMELFNKRIYQIYMTENLNKHHINRNDSNRNLIKKIFEKKIEIKTINILNMKFIDVLNYIREIDLQNFLQTMKENEERKNNKDIDTYMETIRKYLDGFKKWFEDMNGRNTNKKMKK